MAFFPRITAAMIWFLPWKEEDTAKHTPWAVYALIFFNVVVFIAMWSASSGGETDWFDKYGLTPNNWHWYQFITANFIHGDIVHLLGNMLFLWLIGDSIEDALGPIGFLLLYFLGGLAGDLWFVSANPDMAIPSVGGMVVSLLITIWIVPCLFSAVEEWKWKRAQRPTPQEAVV